MRGRITMPEFRGRQPIWMIGRRLDSSTRTPSLARPKYLGLPGPKPLLGLSEATSDKSRVIVVEGPLDLLTLRMWGTAGVALAGTAPSPETLPLLKTFDRVYLALDQDKSGKEATERLCSELGACAERVELPPGIKDVAELAQLVDGEHMFRQALLRAVTNANGSESLAA
jgi:DNA primase